MSFDTLNVFYDDEDSIYIKCQISTNLLNDYDNVKIIEQKYEGKMLGFENNLSDDEIYSIISYIYNSWPNEIKSEWSKLITD